MKTVVQRQSLLDAIQEAKLLVLDMERLRDWGDNACRSREEEIYRGLKRIAQKVRFARVRIDESSEVAARFVGRLREKQLDIF